MLFGEPNPGEAKHLVRMNSDEPIVIPTDVLPPHRADAGDINRETGLCHHAMQFERGSMGDIVDRLADDLLGEDVRIADMLGGAAEFKRNQTIKS